MPTEVCGKAGLPAKSIFGLPPVSEGRNKLRRKKLVRREAGDDSQRLRHIFQLTFLFLNIWLGGEFYLWVHQIESGTSNLTLVRPAGVEGWLPIAGMMNFKYWLSTGHVPAIHPAAMFLLLTFLAIAFLLRKAFCSWLCPIGTLSEYLWRLGRKTLGRNFHLPRRLDIPLRGLKYLLLGFFLWAIAGMSAEAIRGFMEGPYGLIADVKMLDFFRRLGFTGLVVIGTLALASVFIQDFWCRYLCPYGALLGLVARWSPMKIRRNADACVDCAKCAKVCPARLPVDRLMTVRSPECTACLACVAVCPARNALGMSLPPMIHSKTKSQGTPAWAMALVIAVLFLGIVGFAKTAGYWKSYVPSSVYKQLIPRADKIGHPMPGDEAPNAQR
jgi:polyferredoxin